ncbi:carbohydrate kinase family protein [Desertivirga brevis]|uniref:carbohydrate kinase family protein n=1 Tax=Desertivirga brevis TaxID=2810310 RepID=UPI001A964536|nr:carbohydrate kinase [Pedobacter sp. SYSU D00873]
MKRKVVCFGEILWDNLPTGKKPGGAPMNVAYHLNQLGVESTLISRVGDDANGRDILDFLRSKGLSTNHCQIDASYPTSTVEVVIGADNEVSYDIVEPVAWDFIEVSDELDSLVAEADAFVFGSLAARRTVSFKSLNSLLEKAKYRVFDVNLREPYYSPDILTLLLRKTDVLKLNVHELNLLSSWFSSSCSKEWDKINLLQEEFGIEEIVVTKGSSGASYYTRHAQCNYPAYKVKVNDTVGSGDSFLAAFLSQKLKGESIEGILSYASALGAYVTMQSGACPDYKKYDLEQFIWRNELSVTSQFLSK